MVTALAVLSPLTVRLLASVHGTFLLADLCMGTAASQVAEDTAFGQVPHRQHWLRALCRGIPIALRNASDVTVKLEPACDP